MLQVPTVNITKIVNPFISTYNFANTENG